MKHLFPYKGLKDKFLGYSFSQKHKMVIKKENYFDLVNALEYLNKINPNLTLLELVVRYINYDNGKDFQESSNVLHRVYTSSKTGETISFIRIGDLNLMPHVEVKDAKRIIQERLDKVGNREELLTKYGYDCKFGMHLLRLMFEGLELLKTGEIKFPLKERELLKDVREGKWPVTKVLALSEELEKETESLAEVSKLPSKPNFEEIERFCIKKLKDFI